MHAHASPVPARATANERLKGRSGIITSSGVMLAVVLHFAVFAFFPQLTAADLDLRPNELIVIDPPEPIVLPPEPETIPRPMNPVFDPDAPDDQTLFDIDPRTWVPPDVLPPPPTPGRDVEDAPVWVPRTVNPRLLNMREVQRTLERRYPMTLREAGIGGETTVWLLVDEQGSVVQTRIAKPGGHPLLDEAALQVARVMRFSPAYNRDRPVRVWVAQPIRFEARTPRP